MSHTVLAGIITATLIATPVAPAAADRGGKVVQLDVNIAGIDYSTKKGARLVLNRIERAADYVCGVRNGARSPAELRHERECINAAVENAIESISNTDERRAALDAARNS